MNYKEYLNHYKSNLFEDIIPFWEKHSLDKEYGGYFTCLDRKGKVYDTDKFVWLQCRQVWMFSFFYTEIEKKQKWLEIAHSGAEFLKKYGRDNDNNWYFSLTREGKPLIQPYNIFSDCFAAMAFARLSKATCNEEYANIAINTFKNILKRKNNPKGIYNKSFPETRPLKHFGLPMILTNIVLELEGLIENDLFEDVINFSINEVLNNFYKSEFRAILEYVKPDGSFQDSFEGRLTLPGHGLESMWFLMDIAKRKNDNDLIKKLVNISLDLIEYGWDNKYGGIFYMMDVKGKPLDKLEWDQKLWWVHQESMIAMLKGFILSGNSKCWEWFEKLHNYSWEHFSDPEYGEWFGYLNRQGEVFLNLKGGKWKGCFHTPRFMYQIWKSFELLDNINKV